MNALRRPSKAETDEIIIRIMGEKGISHPQARAVFDILGWECFTYQKVLDDVVIIAEEKYEKQIRGFHDNVTKYANCSEVKHIPESKVFAFLVRKESSDADV